jgi:hypothetical protein
MSAGGLTAAGGFLEGFANTYNQARIRATAQDLDQRHQMAGTLAQLYQGARPEAQADIGQRILQIYSTPPGKKLDKKLLDISTLGQQGTQASMQQGAQSAGANVQAGQNAAFGGAAPAPGAGIPPPPGGAPPPPVAPAPGPTAGMAIGGPPSIPPPPNLAAPSSGYSPLLSPDEKSAQAAKYAAAQQEATISAQIRARDEYLQAHPGADPTEVSMALGHQLPMWALKTQVLSRGVLGSDIIKSDPSMRTVAGGELDPSARYDIGTSGVSKFALPTGVGTETALSNEKLKENKFTAALDQFRVTDQYRKWKEQLDIDTRTRIAQMHLDATVNKAPAAMMQTAVFSKGGLERIQDAETAMSDLEAKGVMGSLPANKVQDWIFGKGLVDPSLPPDVRKEIGQLRAALGYTSSAAMRAHTGRTSQEIYEDFKTRLGPGQDWSALRGAIDETKGMLTDYAQSASDANIRSIRSGNNIPPPPGGGGKTVTMKAPNGQTKQVPADQVEHYKSLGAKVVQ